MDICRPSIVLTARWNRAKDVFFKSPDHLAWDDCGPATRRDYQLHRLDTQELIRTRTGGLTSRIYPEIVALAKFDAILERWRIEGPGVIPSVLDVRDPMASDDAIRCAGCKLPTYYRIQIQRLGISGMELLVDGPTGRKERGGDTQSDFDYLWLHCHHRGID